MENCDSIFYKDFKMIKNIHHKFKKKPSREGIDKMLEVLQRNSLTINSIIIYNYSLLHVPQEYDTMKYLIEKNGDVNIKNDYGITPIFTQKKYETIKGSYERDKDYLATITKNGIWIKEKRNKKNNIIRSSNLQNQKLMNISIYQFDKNNNFLKRIEAKSGDISSLNWMLSDVRIVDNEGKILEENLDTFSYFSSYDIEKIQSLYSNLDAVSFWNIANEIELLEERGYSTKQMETKLQRSFAFPFFLLAMVFLSGVFTLGSTFKENNAIYIFITIASCVLIYFFNDFSAALGKTEKLAVEVAVWMPILIIFIFSTVGMIYANQK